MVHNNFFFFLIMWWFCIIQNLTNSQILYSETLKTRVEYLLVKKNVDFKRTMLLPQQLSQQDKRPRPLSLSFSYLKPFIQTLINVKDNSSHLCLCDLLALMPDVSEGLRQEGRMWTAFLPPELLVLLLFTFPSVVTAPKLLIWRSHPLCLHRDGRRNRRGWRELSYFAIPRNLFHFN